MKGLLCASVLTVFVVGCGGARDDIPEVNVSGNQNLEEISAASFADQDWPWWRGPSHNGIAADGPAPPVKWSATENVVWKTDVPGRGHSSPTVVGQRVMLTTADESKKVQSVIAFDRESGDQLWKTDVNEGGFPNRIHNKNTHASGSVTSDGERLFASFFNHDAIKVTALDLDGNKLWEKEAGPFKPRQFEYGYAPSPFVYKSLVIVAADYDGGGYLAALHRKTGDIVWRKPRPAVISYSSPVVAKVGGRDQLLISGCEIVAGYDPATGEQLWSCDATTRSTCGTMVWDGDLVFASGGYPKAETVAVRADGSGEILWRNNTKCYEQSMLAHDGHVYAVDDRGIATCWQAESGEEKWRGRLRGPVSASPVLAGGNLYLSNEAGTTFVFKANPDAFELVAENRLGDDAFATPTICGGQIFLRVASQMGGRRQEMLYCIGSGK